ncbi:hypothetical protein FOH10_02030 [Nocardia otitidiscaviarum]|uniref:Uncharacterized protein n=1 Tax=Nocardia otitidiscaviarum TaxID=1823 RepID=A0A516NFP1_9NOCA|nr:hypothetical protein [Nocardia otitidiscaviarum]MCP9623031.1 hypothetical protein [Nocardia otitidiscaviarum]QDP77701.1 hypothetical protein FOH10_02030 [Nocardia otitidiscaviarum]
MTARDGGHLSYLHRDDGIWPVGEDGWPITAEQLAEPDCDMRGALSLLGHNGEIIDVEPESVEDVEPDAP